MSALLERYKQQATLLDYDPLPDVLKLSAHQPRLWKPWMDELSEHELTMLAGGFAGLEKTPVTVNQATVTGSATEQVLIPIALTAIATDPQVPKLYRLFASGTSTTAGTPGTYTLAARIGPAPTNASPLFGAVSGSFTPVASATAARWDVTGWVMIRTGGTTAVAVASFDWMHSATVGGGGPSLATSTGVFGGISASFDSTLGTTALWIGVTHAVSTTNTWIPQAVAWGSWN